MIYLSSPSSDWFALIGGAAGATVSLASAMGFFYSRFKGWLTLILNGHTQPINAALDQLKQESCRHSAKLAEVNENLSKLGSRSEQNTDGLSEHKAKLDNLLLLARTTEQRVTHIEERVFK